MPGGDQVVGAANRAIEQTLAGGALVVYTQDWHPPQTPHFEDQGAAGPATACRAPGGELHPDLRVEGPVVRKGTEGEDGYSGLSVRDPETGEEDATALDGMLRERDIRRVVVAGLAQDVCVHETARDAVDKGYDTTVLLAATRPVAPDEADKLVAELRDIGVNHRVSPDRRRVGSLDGAESKGASHDPSHLPRRADGVTGNDNPASARR